jgi:orotate phosphoribosyltransferase
VSETSTELAVLLARLSYKKGRFRLASGRTSDFYIDVRQTVMTPEGAGLIGRLLLDRIEAAGLHSVGGMAVGAVPLVTATLVEADRRGYQLDGFFCRRQAKDHGTAAKLDGRFDPARPVALVEDVVTTGGSTREAAQAVVEAGGEVGLIVAVVDRQEDEGLERLAGAVGPAGRVEALVGKADIVAAADD